MAIMASPLLGGQPAFAADITGRRATKNSGEEHEHTMHEAPSDGGSDGHGGAPEDHHNHEHRH